MRQLDVGDLDGLAAIAKDAGATMLVCGDDEGKLCVVIGELAWKTVNRLVHSGFKAITLHEVKESRSGTAVVDVVETGRLFRRGGEQGG